MHLAFIAVAMQRRCTITNVYAYNKYDADAQKMELASGHLSRSGGNIAKQT